MKTIIKSVVLASILTLAACSKEDSKSKGEDSEGNCTFEAVDAYNDINSNLESFKITKHLDNIKAIRNACVKLQGLIGSSSCKAENLTTGEVQQISYSDVQTICDTANEVLISNTVNKQPISMDTRKVSSLLKGITLVVKNEEVLNELLRYSDSKFIQDGKVINGIDYVDRNKHLCFLSSGISNYEVKNGDVLEFPHIESIGKKAAFLNVDENKKLQMGCLKVKSNSDWTVQELKDVLADSVEVNIVE